MRKFIVFLGFAAIDAALARAAPAPLFLAERPDGATALLLAAGLFTIAIAAVVRNDRMFPPKHAFSTGAPRAS